MLALLWRVLRPFHAHYLRHLAGVAVRQALLVAGGYLMVAALRYCLQHAGAPEWLFFVAFLFYDAGFVSFDLFLNHHFVSRLGYPLFARLRLDALRKLFAMPLDWHYSEDAGALMGKVNNGVGKVVQTAEGLGRELAPALIRTFLSLIPLCVLSPVTAPAILASLVCFLWLTQKENRIRQPYRETRHQNYNRDFGLFAESVQYLKPIVQFGQTQRMLDRYETVQQDIMADGMRETRVGNRFGWGRNMLLSVLKRGCQCVWIWQYRRGSLDMAMLMYLNMVTEELLNSFWSYAALIERVQDGLEPTRVLLQLLNEQPAISDQPTVKALEAPQAVGIEMVDIRFAYSRGESVMKGFNLSIPAGSVLGVAGPSGGGKTTIHNLLSRMFEVHSGHILVSGQEIRDWPLEQLRGLFSYVSQADGVFFSDTTLFDTIRFARPNASFREVVQAAKTACIHEDIMRMPEQYGTVLGQRGLTLSKGQQQRIAIAQAILALDDTRRVLILDEFTSALDSRTEQRILENLLPLVKGRTVIIIAHRLSTIRGLADRIVVVEKGELIEQGSHEELLAVGGWYAEMARLQAVA